MRQKEPYKDATIDIFIRANSLKYPTKEEYISRIRADVYRRLALQNPQMIILKADAEVSSRKSIIGDIDAVDKVFANLKERNRQHIIDAVKEVYFPYKGRRWIPRDVYKDRVLAFATKNYATPQSVNNWLREARMLCAYYKGLTVTEPEHI